MKYLNTLLALCFFATLLSCEEEDKQRQAQTLKSAKQSDSIFKIISTNWKFNVPPPTPKVQVRITTWNEWHQFKAELAQKPTGDLTAFRQKTKNLVEKADKIRQNIPAQFNKPQVHSRLGVLVTRIKTLYTFLNVDPPQDKKVLVIISDISKEIASIQNQLDEIIRISEIPKEMGEQEMLRALDTVRMANPDRMPQPTSPQPQGPDRQRTFNTQKP